MINFLNRLFCFVFAPIWIVLLILFNFPNWVVRDTFYQIKRILYYLGPWFYCALFYPTCGWYQYFYKSDSYYFKNNGCGPYRWFWRAPKLSNWVVCPLDEFVN